MLISPPTKIGIGLQNQSAEALFLQLERARLAGDAGADHHDFLRRPGEATDAAALFV